MTAKKGKILIIDDSESILFLLENILADDFDVTAFTRASDALKIANHGFDTIIIDLMMPEMSGVEFIRRFRDNPDLAYIPIIVLTAKHNTERDVAKLFEIGVNDYITKPFYSAELVARVKTHAKLKMLTEKLIEANQKLRYTATHDELTKVYNRNTIFNFLENEILRLKRSKKSLVLMMFDIDFFKEINDAHGHQAGDYTLLRIIQIIKESVREIDLIGRYGGDEFLIILPDTNLVKANDIAMRFLDKIRKEKFVFNDNAYNVTLSIGLAEYKPQDGINQFIERLDNALYDAKKNGRNCVLMR